MEMVAHTVSIRGESVAAGRPRPEALGWVLRYIEPVVRDSVSMGFRNTSSLPGRPPAWLSRACDVRLVGISEDGPDGTRLHFEAPRLGGAAEEIYGQGELFRIRPDEHDTGFDLLGDAVADVRKEDHDSIRFDAKLLREIHRLYDGPSKRGVEQIILLGGRLPVAEPISIDQAVSAHANRMRQITPPAQRARIAGKLDMIRDSDSVFEVLLGDGETVRGVWLPGEMGRLQELFREDVLIEGKAVYRPSRKLLRLEADAVRPAAGGDAVFREIPRPLVQATPPRVARQAQTRAGGAGSIHAQWPGDETEDEILAALKGMG